uniref:Granulins domain-containing protein n=1 Tax=Monopterus albus TaxID=43700 RepID=A0A3Q3JB41_MONAL
MGPLIALLMAAKTCDNPTGSPAAIPWLEKVSALTVSDEKCDQQTICPRGSTCCRSNSGQWACCPLPQAVCCDDHEHCCPKGYRCNVAEQTCDKPGGLSLPWLQKEPSQAVSSPGRPWGWCVQGDELCCFYAKHNVLHCCQKV